MKKEKYDRATRIDHQIISLREKIDSLQDAIEQGPFSEFEFVLLKRFNSGINITLNKEEITLLIQKWEEKIRILEKEFESL